MTDRDDFAAFMEGQTAPVVGHLARGERVTGIVTHIGADSVFLNLGTRADGMVPRVDLQGRDGELRVSVGDSLSATVVDVGEGGGPILAVTLGRDSSVDLAALELALDSGTPVVGKVSRVVKAGLEVDLGGVRAFCPASQVDLTYVGDLTTFAEQELRVAVLEIKEDGRSVVVSRKRVLELERQEAAKAARDGLVIGAEALGTVTSIQPYGAFVDLGGVEGLVHISEISGSHVSQVEDVLTVGEEVNVQVLAVEDTDKGPRIRLSMKALGQSAKASSENPQMGEVLIGKVQRFLPHGVIVATEKGEGFVHKRELGLPQGADHRRALAVDQELEVALVEAAPGKLRFSVSQVEEVLAAQDFKAYRKEQSELGGMGSLFGQLKKLELGKLPPGPPPSAVPTARKEAAASTKGDAQMSLSATTTAAEIDASQVAAAEAEPAEPKVGPSVRRRRIVSRG